MMLERLMLRANGGARIFSRSKPSCPGDGAIATNLVDAIDARFFGGRPTGLRCGGAGAVAGAGAGALDASESSSDATTAGRTRFRRPRPGPFGFSREIGADVMVFGAGARTGRACESVVARGGGGADRCAGNCGWPTAGDADRSSTGCRQRYTERCLYSASVAEYGLSTQPPSLALISRKMKGHPAGRYAQHTCRYGANDLAVRSSATTSDVPRALGATGSVIFNHSCARQPSR